jgi:Holliday junction resolvasome RuvABC endonuclease subunit
MRTAYATWETLERNERLMLGIDPGFGRRGYAVSCMTRYRPREAAVEKLFFGKHAPMASAVAQARGVTLLALAQRG